MEPNKQALGVASGEFRAQSVARPEGFEHTPPTIAIEGLQELIDALLAA